MCGIDLRGKSGLFDALVSGLLLIRTVVKNSLAELTHGRAERALVRIGFGHADHGQHRGEHVC